MAKKRTAYKKNKDKLSIVLTPVIEQDIKEVEVKK
jgi:hypothetical protein